MIKAFIHLFHPKQSNNHRAKLLHPEALFGLVGILVVISLAGHGLLRFSPLGYVLGYASSIDASDVVRQTNMQRQTQGLSTLTVNSALSEAAIAKAQDMFNVQYWAHTSPQGKEPWDFIRASGYGFRTAGENLARDFATTPDMISAWMDSPSHRANILNGNYQEIGVAVVNGVLQGTETTLVVQMFGSPVNRERLPETATVATTETSPTPTTSVRTIELQNEFKPAGVKAALAVPAEDLRSMSRYSPLALFQSITLSVLLLILTVALYDHFAIGHRVSLRIVGKNLAHILFIIFVIFCLLLITQGRVI